MGEGWLQTQTRRNRTISIIPILIDLIFHIEPIMPDCVVPVVEIARVDPTAHRYLTVENSYGA